MKTIAELEAESNAAAKAYDDAACRHRLIAAALSLADDLAEIERDEMLTDEDRAAFRGTNLPGLHLALQAREKAARADMDRLEDAADAAARALNDAPEEAA